MREVPDNFDRRQRMDSAIFSTVLYQIICTQRIRSFEVHFLHFIASRLLYINLYSPFNMVETTTKKKTNKKHSQQTITHYDSDITCPEIFSDYEQAGHSANQSKTLPGIEQQPVYH